MSYIELKNVKKVYEMGEVGVRATDGITCSIEQGELAVVYGPSGSGKTTFLNVLGGVDNPSSGQVTVDSVDVSGMDEKQLDNYRMHDVGFVFQSNNLISNLTVIENVELAKQTCEDSLNSEEVLYAAGIAGKMDNFSSQLVVEEQQMAAIARAFVKNPKIILCDEPTGDLTCSSGKKILKTIQDLAKKHNKTVVLFTHNPEICAMGDRIIKLSGGKVEKEAINKEPISADKLDW